MEESEAEISRGVGGGGRWEFNFEYVGFDTFVRYAGGGVKLEVGWRSLECGRRWYMDDI